MAIEVRIPTILRTYTGGAKSVEGSGGTLDELFTSLQEGVSLYLAGEGEQSGPLHVASATLTDHPFTSA